MPLSSHTRRSGIGPPRWAVQQAALMAPAAVEWFAEASPKLAMTMASRGSQGSGGGVRRERPTAKAVPIALGRWLAMVEVWGGMLSAREPSTLWRPPDMGSEAAQAKLRRMSRAGS